MLTIGFKQTFVAFRECMRLKQTFLYLIFYFLMYVALARSSPADTVVDCSSHRDAQGRCPQHHSVS